MPAICSGNNGYCHSLAYTQPVESHARFSTACRNDTIITMQVTGLIGNSFSTQLVEKSIISFRTQLVVKSISFSTQLLVISRKLLHQFSIVVIPYGAFNR